MRLTDVITSSFLHVDVCQGGEKDNEDQRPQGAARLVNIGEDLGGVSSFGESSEGSRTGIDTGETDGQDRDTDGDVDQMVQTLDLGHIERDDEGRLGSTASAGETGLVVWDEETDDGQRGDIDDGDTPESTLDRSGHGLARVGGLRGSKTDELGSG